MWTLIKFLLILLNLTCLPINCFVILSLLIYKQAVCLVAKRFQKFVEPISDPSSIFVCDKYNSNPHAVIIVAIGLDRICSINEMTRWVQHGYDIRDEFGQRCYREFGYTPVRYFGYGFWKKVPDFKMNRIHEISETTGIRDEETSMKNIVANLQRQPFQPDEPLWDFYLQSNHTEKRTTIYFRFHHMLGDGMSFTKFVYALSGCDNLPETFTQPRSAFSRWDYIQKHIFGRLWTAIQVISVGPVEYMLEYFLKKDRHDLHYNSKGEIKFAGIWKCTFGKRFDLQGLKRASRHLKCSISHILLAGINTGLEKYFAKYYGNKETPTFRYNTVLPLPNHPNKRLVNCWTVGKFYSPKFNLDIRKKIEYMKGEMRRVQTSILTVYIAHLFQSIAAVFPWQVLDYLYKTKATGTLTFSNMVGPQDDDKLIAGSKVTDMWLWLPVPQEGVAIAAGIISCNGGLRICYTADVGSIEKREELEDLNDMIYSTICDIIALDD